MATMPVEVLGDCLWEVLSVEVGHVGEIESRLHPRGS
jgi:hypothetical protein